MRYAPELKLGPTATALFDAARTLSAVSSPRRRKDERGRIVGKE